MELVREKDIPVYVAIPEAFTGSRVRGVFGTPNNAMRRYDVQVRNYTVPGAPWTTVASTWVRSDRSSRPRAHFLLPGRYAGRNPTPGVSQTMVTWRNRVEKLWEA